MKIKNFKYTLSTLLLILINSSYSWAEAFKGGPSDGQYKVLFFLILIGIVSAIVTGILLFAYLIEVTSKYEMTRNKKRISVVFVGSVLFLAIYNLVIIPVIVLGSLIGIGFLMRRLSNPETQYRSVFLKALSFLIAWIAFTILIIIITF